MCFSESDKITNGSTLARVASNKQLSIYLSVPKSPETRLSDHSNSQTDTTEMNLISCFVMSEEEKTRL